MLLKKQIIGFIAILLLIGCSNDLWDKLPSQLSTFVSNYYPLSSISQYSEKDGNYYVTIKNGASIVFDSQYHWIAIDGKGNTLPSIFVTDQMPEVLLRYLQETEAVNGVYAAQNEPREIILDMLNYKIRYEKSTQTVMEEK